MTRRSRQPRSFIAVIILSALAAVMTYLQQTSRKEQPAPQPRAEAPRPRVEVPAPVEVPPASNDEWQLPDVSAEERSEILETLALIERGGPYPYQKDGTVFRNAERRLPSKPRNYYREYTVETAGSSTRGASRIVRGEGGETYYSRDHYRTFVRLR